MALSREERGLCGTGGWPGLRLFSRLQWRDRGRFTRPSPLPLNAGVNYWLEGLAVLPVGLGLFDQGAEAFLRIFEAVEFVQENVHGMFEPLAQ